MINSEKWITDRLPTADDADSHWTVWTTQRDGTLRKTGWSRVSFVTCRAWMRVEPPEPYQPPEPDTLAASIKALEAAQANAFFADTVLDGGIQADEAIDRVIAAARKWEELERKKHKLVEVNPLSKLKTLQEEDL